MKRLLAWALIAAIVVLYSLTVYGWWVEGNNNAREQLNAKDI